MHAVRGQPLGTGRVEPLELAGHPQAALITVDHRLRRAQLVLHLRIGRPDSRGYLLGGCHHRALAHTMPVEVGEHLARFFQGDKLILVEIHRLGLQGRSVLHRLGHIGGEGALGGLSTVGTVLDLGTMLRDLHPHWRQLQYLPSLVGTGGHLLQRDLTGPTTLDGVKLVVVRLGRGLQRMALVAWLRATLFPTAGAETVRAGLLQAVAARGLAAVAAVFPQVVLEGVHPCLEVEDEGSQHSHQGQHGFFTLQAGGMDIVWGRQFLGCHIIHYALFLSALHEGMLHFLVCLSSYLHMMFRLAPCAKMAPQLVSRLSSAPGVRVGRTRDEAQRWRRRSTEETDTWHKKVMVFSWCTSISTPSTSRNSTSGITPNICRNCWRCLGFWRRPGTRR